MSKRFFHKFFKSQKNKKIIFGGLTILVLIGAGKIAYLKLPGTFTKDISQKAGDQNNVVNINNIGTIHTFIVGLPNASLPASEKPPESIPLSNEKPEEMYISCSFTYLKSGEAIPQLDAEQRSPTSRNPVARIYNKLSKINQLQRELNGLPPLLLMQSRPMSMQLQAPASVSEEVALKKIESDLDENLARVEKMLANNPVKTELAFAQL